MPRGIILYFYFYTHCQSLIGLIRRNILAISALTALVLTIPFLFYIESSFTIASSQKLPHNTPVPADSQKSIKELMEATKIEPRSRLARSAQKIFSTPPAEDKSFPTHSITLDIPILMYHKTPSDFEAQLQHLQARSYTPITMKVASRILRGIEPPPSKPVVITYDDGFSDQLIAYSLLKKYRMVATFYIMPGGELSGWCVGADRHSLDCGDSYLNWSEIKAIGDSGLIEIGSHTVDHAQLNALNSEIKRSQIISSKVQIEQQIRREVVSFAYPYGTFDAEAINIVREAGYTSAVSTIAGTAQSTDSLYGLRRIRNAFDLN